MTKKNNYRGKNKSKTSNSKQNTKEINTPKESYNDASWYAANPQILKDAASLAFSTPQGGKIDVLGRPARIPGIMKLDITCIPGFSDSATSAVNIAARNIYSYVRHANSGHANYESPDLMMYLIAMDQAYSYYSWMRRIYALSRTYFQKNRYVPKWLIESMGVDYDDLIINLADFRLYINTFAQKCGSLVTPAGMTYFQRHSWVFSNIFADSTTAKAQFMYFNPKQFGIYEGFTDKKGGKVVYKSYLPESGNMKIQDFINFGNSILEPLLADEDINIMSGDILKAFGEGSTNKLGMVVEDESLMPVYNPEVLTQIQNARADSWNSDLEVTQTDGFIKCLLNVGDTGLSDLDSARLFNMPFDNVEAADVMVASRLIYTATNDGNVTSAGTEIFHGFNIYRISDDGNELVRSSYYVGPYTGETTGTSYTDTVRYLNFKNAMELFTDLQMFAYHPYALWLLYTEENSVKTLVNSYTAGDVENYTVIDTSDIMQMNEVAILNEFDVPQMGVYK